MLTISFKVAEVICVLVVITVLETARVESKGLTVVNVEPCLVTEILEAVNVPEACVLIAALP